MGRSGECSGGDWRAKPGPSSVVWHPSARNASKIGLLLIIRTGPSLFEKRLDFVAELFKHQKIMKTMIRQMANRITKRFNPEKIMGSGIVRLLEAGHRIVEVRQPWTG